MPQGLKEEIRERLEGRVQEIGESDLIDKIATEGEATTSEQLLEFLGKVGHPVLEMESII
ncbi:MAG: hypothetical protein GWO44_16165 [Thermoplasmata archaeon]|nr:hypothetical protein [Thermoplasmata archaeon]NIY04738.1 hypothetical protein [Thermoplasmata archaeon]